MKNNNRDFIIKNILGKGSNKQSEINNLDDDQRNYRPEEESVIHIDFSDLVKTIDTLESQVKDSIEKKQKVLVNQELYDSIKTITGEVIQKKRKELNMTQQNIADTGFIARSYLSDVETGKVEISLITLLMISKALEIHPSVLVNDIQQKVHSEINRPDKPCFYKNLIVQVGYKKFITMSVYDTEKGRKIVLTEEDFKFYQTKYEKNVYFYLDKKELYVNLASTSGKIGIKYKVVNTNTDESIAIEFK